MSKKKFLNVKVRAAKTADGKLNVTFGYFDIYPNVVIDVTDKLSAIDRSDFERLVFTEDPFIETNIL
ncbi:MAG: hypothetical protein Q8M92_01885, partial [Candidatus Subteraquimicrobiales bacterium]|nr:hypothetical protein [Candidatus Subteraquimicrobiales bacterium]